MPPPTQLLRVLLASVFALVGGAVFSQQVQYGQPPSFPPTNWGQPPLIPGSPLNQFYAPPSNFDPYASQQVPNTAPPSQYQYGTPSPTFENPPALILNQPLLVAPAITPVRFVVSGEFIYLRASDAAMTSFAVPVNGAIVPPPTPAVPLGAVAAVDLNFEPGFKVGLDWVWNDYSRWVVGYTSLGLSSTETQTIDPAAPLALQALVLHPSTAAADTYFLDATATGDLAMRIADVEYRRIFVEDWYRWDFLAGLRYAHLDQGFKADFTNSTTTEKLDSEVNFDGGGIRVGTRGDWRSNQHGFLLYGQATTSFLAGRFNSSYTQSDSFLGTVVKTSRSDDRIVNVTDIELGIGWRSPTQRWYFSGGYLFNTWSDVVNNAGLIRAVQTTSFAPVRERLTLDGFTVRGEFRF